MKRFKKRIVLGLLAENGRLNKLESVVGSFESIMRAHRGELFVQVCCFFMYPNQKFFIQVTSTPTEL